jgi:hypothetical protein
MAGIGQKGAPGMIPDDVRFRGEAKETVGPPARFRTIQVWSEDLLACLWQVKRAKHPRAGPECGPSFLVAPTRREEAPMRGIRWREFIFAAARPRYGEHDEELHAIAVGGAAWRNRPWGGSGSRGDTRRHVGNKSRRGELTFAEGGQETVYKAGEYFFETGNLAHTAQNKTNVPLRILVVEILPKDWTAPAMIAPRSQ